MVGLFRAFAVLLAVFLTSFAAPAFSQLASGQAEPMILPVDPAPLVLETGGGERRFTIEIADTDGERSAGLMFRNEMNDDHGMLFVFEQTRRLSFWMQNTPMPLDLIFIGEDGRVVAIRWGKPFSTAPIAPLSPARFVLELKAGTAQNAGLTEGDRVRHPRIDEIAGTQ